jgi:hypothetical protein
VKTEETEEMDGSSSQQSELKREMWRSRRVEEPGDYFAASSPLFTDQEITNPKSVPRNRAQ